MAELTLLSSEEMSRRRHQGKGYLDERPNGSWIAHWVEPEIDPATGKRPKRARKIGTWKGPGKITERQARRVFWDDILSKLDQNTLHPGSGMTLGEFVVKRWMPDRTSKLSAKTRQGYKTQLDNHILPTFGKKALRDIRTADVQDLINRKMAWRGEKGEALSPSSIKAILTTLKACLNHAQVMDYLPGKIPTKGVSLPKERTPEKQALTWEQIQAIADALPEPISTLVIFLSLTGLRIGEACGLRWEHVNLTRKPQLCGSEILAPMTVAVRENWVLGKRQDLKTRKSRRDVPITPLLAKRIARMVLSAGALADSSVFANSGGSDPIDAHNVANRILKPLVKELGLPWVSYHAFRHSNASLAERAGMTESQRMKMLGHSNKQMTQRYTHPEAVSARASLTKISAKRPIPINRRKAS